MHKLDSTLRESARLNSIATVGLNRAVIAKDGIVTPSGVKIPYGAAVGVPRYPILMETASTRMRKPSSIFNSQKNAAMRALSTSSGPPGHL